MLSSVISRSRGEFQKHLAWYSPKELAGQLNPVECDSAERKSFEFDVLLTTWRSPSFRECYPQALTWQLFIIIGRLAPLRQVRQEPYFFWSAGCSHHGFPPTNHKSFYGVFRRIPIDADVQWR